MTTLFLCAAGNAEGIRLALNVNRAERRWDEILLLDDDVAKHGTEKLGVRVVGGFDRLRDADPASTQVVNLVTRTTEGRARARAKIAAYGSPFTSLVHPSVDLLGTSMDDEVSLYPNASIGAGAHVGQGSVVLIGAVVGHGVHVGRGCVIAPNAVINARVRLGDRVYVGSNASIVPDVTIGEGATIAANSVVVSDVPPHSTAFGVPATVLPSRDAIATTPIALATHAEPSRLEPEVSEIVSEILKATAISPCTNFFEMGCDSLKALRIWELLRKRMHVEVSLVDLYHYPTVRALAAHLDGGGAHVEMDQAVRRAELRRQLRAHR